MFVLRVIRGRVETDATCPMYEALVRWSGKRFGAHVCKHFLSFDMLRLSVLSFLFLLTESGVNAEVFGSRSHPANGCNRFNCLVVLVDGDGINEMIVEGGGEVTEDLGTDVGSAEASEFSIGRMKGYSRSLFAFPSDGGACDGEDITKHGSVLDEVARITRVSEDGWLFGEGNMFLIVWIPNE